MLGVYLCNRGYAICLGSLLSGKHDHGECIAGIKLSLVQLIIALNYMYMATPTSILKQNQSSITALNQKHFYVSVFLFRIILESCILILFLLVCYEILDVDPFHILFLGHIIIIYVTVLTPLSTMTMLYWLSLLHCYTTITISMTLLCSYSHHQREQPSTHAFFDIWWHPLVV